MIRGFMAHTPEIDPGSFIANSAEVIGQVSLAEDVSVWFNTVMRGDVNSITVGKGTNIQDLTMVHLDHDQPTTIGEYVTIGHSTIIHGCTIEDNVLIGMGAILLNGVVIEKDVIVGAGTLIPPGKRIPSRSLVVGSPGKVVRTLSDNEVESIRASAERYIALSKVYLNGEGSHEKE